MTVHITQQTTGPSKNSDVLQGNLRAVVLTLLITLFLSGMAIIVFGINVSHSRIVWQIGLGLIGVGAMLLGMLAGGALDNAWEKSRARHNDVCLPPMSKAHRSHKTKRRLPETP